jgi:predicted HNH restriction endonuclease
MRADFDVPIFEQYENGPSRYGIYDPTKPTFAKLNKVFATRAVAFYADVLSSLRPSSNRDLAVTIYPKMENRTRVTSHIKRERSQYLATECKIRDNHVCQVCKFSFEDTYGTLGLQFAEAHHIVPLSKMGENILTRVSDLITVCSNCHRMLHRMEGKATDVSVLKELLRKRPKR